LLNFSFIKVAGFSLTQCWDNSEKQFAKWQEKNKINSKKEKKTY
jgi:hypothetical protein